MLIRSTWRSCRPRPRSADGWIDRPYVIEQTEEYGRHVNIEASDVGRTHPPEPRLRCSVDEHIELPERQETAPGVGGLRLKPLLITAIGVTTVQRIPSKHV